MACMRCMAKVGVFPLSMGWSDLSGHSFLVGIHFTSPDSRLLGDVTNLTTAIGSFLCYQANGPLETDRKFAMFMTSEDDWWSMLAQDSADQSKNKSDTLA